MMMDCIQRRVTVRQKGSLDTCLRPMTTTIANGEALDDEEEEGADDASSSAFTTGLVAGQYYL